MENSDMRLVNSIKMGIVIDHITAGLGVKLYHYLKLDETDITVALITNAKSKQMGAKDIIKIQDMIDFDYEVLGLIDKNLTINIIQDGKITGKQKLRLPKRVENVIYCKNPRCITSIEKHIPHVFHLKNEDEGLYECIYCEDLVSKVQI